MNAAYHQHYAVGSIEDAEALLWPENGGELQFSLDGRPGSETKPSMVWAAIHSQLNSRTSKGLVNRANRPVHLRVHLTYDYPDTVNIVAFMKPLLDGVISALQYCPQPNNNIAATISLALQHRFDPLQIDGWLRKSEYAALGRNDRLVVPYRTGVKWNPDDHLCHGALITMEHRAKAAASGAATRCAVISPRSCAPASAAATTARRRCARSPVAPGSPG